MWGDEEETLQLICALTVSPNFLALTFTTLDAFFKITNNLNKDRKCLYTNVPIKWNYYHTRNTSTHLIKLFHNSIVGV